MCLKLIPYDLLDLFGIRVAVALVFRKDEATVDEDIEDSASPGDQFDTFDGMRVPYRLSQA